jgi:hypothetical protein
MFSRAVLIALKACILTTVLVAARVTPIKAAAATPFTRHVAITALETGPAPTRAVALYNNTLQYP